MNFSKEDLLPYIKFKTSRSSGSGGQHVNKVSTKVELLFNFQAATFFSEDEKMIISKKLRSRVLSESIIQIVNQETRSQVRNKERAVDQLIILLQKALEVQKPRKPTKPSKKAIQNRLDRKRYQALKKINRGGNWD